MIQDTHRELLEKRYWLNVFRCNSLLEINVEVTIPLIDATSRYMLVFSITNNANHFPNLDAQINE